MAQLASASGLGPEGPVFESQYPDIRGTAGLTCRSFYFISRFLSEHPFGAETRTDFPSVHTGEIAADLDLPAEIEILASEMLADVVP